MHFFKILATVIALPIIITPLSQANASQIFLGGDKQTVNLNNIPRITSTPQSDAAKNNFLSKLLNPQTENFESSAPGNANSTAINFSGTTATFNGKGTIFNLPSGTLAGQYPTSGNQFLQTSNGDFQVGVGFSFNSFDFSTPVSAAGFYLTGIIDTGASTVVELSKLNGTNQKITIPFGYYSNGNYEHPIVYVGAIADNPSDYITKIRFDNAGSSRRSGLGLDDLTVSTTPVPEPLTILGSLGAGLVGILLRFKQKKEFKL